MNKPSRFTPRFFSCDGLYQSGMYVHASGNYVLFSDWQAEHDENENLSQCLHDLIFAIECKASCQKGVMPKCLCVKCSIERGAQLIYQSRKGK